ncbi:Tubby-related protein 3 [Phytophthora cinnamomi]|uniref:Tubby-related protein 3 n=1 Tax=Phytophthora cinnamomi TaxID=4785 RepID=UPI003559570E|nr:Tubby-related protein 3 [Phytophthora cinnamomi]
MVDRHFDLLEHLDARDDDLVDYLPPPATNRRLRALLKDLKKVESVSKALQRSDVTLLDARVWFDGLLAIKPHYEKFIGPRAKIVHSPDFEAGTVRVLGGNVNRLKRGEKAALEPFRSQDEVSQGTGDGSSDEDASEDEGSFVEQLQKRRRLATKEATYELLSCIEPTSNVAERFFSTARTTFGQKRHSLQPITLEMILFLRQNSGYWDARTVDDATR